MTKKTPWWQWLIMLLVAAFLLYFAFRGVKWQDFAAGIASCDFRWIGVSMLASILAFVVRGLRWRLIMLPLNGGITRRNAYDGVTVAYLTNFALPRAGEFARCGVIAATGKASFESVLGTVVLERSWDMLSYIIILLVVLFAGESKFMEFVSENVLAQAAGSFSAATLWIVFSLLVIAAVGLLLIYKYRKRLERNRFAGKIVRVMSGLWDGLVTGIKMKDKWTFLLYTVLLWACYWVMSYTTILAFPQVSDLNWADAMFLMVVGGMGWIVPVQGGIGAYHFILSLAMASIYGIPQTSGVVFATISHESQALTMLVCGAVSLFSIYLSKTKKRKTV